MDHLDRYALVVNKGFYLVDPGKLSWWKINVPQIPTAGRRQWSWPYMDYDSKRRLLVLNLYKTWWGLRLAPKDAPQKGS